MAVAAAYGLPSTIDSKNRRLTWASEQLFAKVRALVIVTDFSYPRFVGIGGAVQAVRQKII